MAGSLATTADVATKMQRDLTAPELASAALYLRVASAQVRRRVASIDTLIQSGDVDADLVMDVVSEAVVRVLRNPSGVGQQTVGGGSESATWTPVQRSTRIVITDDDIALLTPLSSGLSVGGAAVGTVGLRKPWWVAVDTWQENTSPWDPVPFGGDPRNI